MKVVVTMLVRWILTRYMNILDEELHSTGRHIHKNPVGVRGPDKGKRRRRGAAPSESPFIQTTVGDYLDAIPAGEVIHAEK